MIITPVPNKQNKATISSPLEIKRQYLAASLVTISKDDCTALFSNIINDTTEIFQVFYAYIRESMKKRSQEMMGERDGK